MDGSHEGPCLNFEGQDPAYYDEWDSCYLHIEMSQRRKAEVLAIIRAVAAAEPVVEDHSELYPRLVCGACEAEKDGGMLSRGDEVVHEPTCPWLLAYEWVQRDVDGER